MPSATDIDSISSYLRAWAPELGDRIVQTYPPLQGFDDVSSPLVGQLLRKPFPAQTLAIMGVVKRWNRARGAAVIAECGTGKTLISLGAVHLHSDRKPFTALAMVPPQLVEKWAREAFLTLPRVRIFFIDGLRTPASSVGRAGVNEVRLRHGRIVREGLRTTLTELRLRKTARTARKRWDSICGFPALFIVGRERGKLSYFWRHAYGHARCGRYLGSLINSDTGRPVYLGEHGERLLSADFKKAKLSEILGARNGDESTKVRRPLYSALWQADGKKIRRFAPVDFIGRYMPDFFDYAIADEVHELKGDTAQGNALGTLAASAQHTAVLTGTLLGGYADEVFNILYRLEPGKMVKEGFEYGEAGVRAFTEAYGLLEKITVIEPADNVCSEARVTKRIRRRPGASPLLFGRFLMSLGAFISLEDISEALPPYREEVLSVEMDAPLSKAYKKLEQDVKTALKEHRGNPSVMSVALNALLLYPDRPFRLGNLYGWEFDPETQRREKFLISETQDLDERLVYAKERRLIEEVKTELARGRRCQIYAVYTQKRDVTRRLERILSNEGIRVAVLTTEVPPESREGWYDRQLRSGIEAVICHPKLVQTGLDLIDFPTILFYETGYSIYVLRQASRRSWRIGQRVPVKVKFLHYAETMQESCLRLMGRKLLVSLAMEGKFSSEGLQAINEEDDILMAMARELVTEKGIGERADAIWSALQKKQEEVFAVKPSEVEPAAELVHNVGLAESEPSLSPSNPLLPLATPVGPIPRKASQREHVPEGQLTLF
ncbi:MAG TPA: helicase-related protein [Candidatus Acidoferrales bacterium]|nr:helicase-related protein [Candidatus Acidoferrales bacterium]